MSSTALFNLSTAPVTGTWTNNNSLGFTFDAVSSVTVTHLGIFDSGGDGIGTARTVRLHEFPSGTVLASATINPGDGTLEGVFRYVSITPITLSPGTYRLAGGSFTSPDPGWQSGDGGTWSETQVGGRILTGLAYVGTADTMPTSPFSKFTRVGASLKAQDEGINPAMVMSVSANLSAIAALESSPAMTMSVSATLTAGSALTASPSMVMSVSAPLAGSGALASSPAMTMSVSAPLAAEGSLLAAPAMVMSVDATLEDLSPPSATATMEMTVIADLTGVIIGDAYTLQAQRTAWEVEPGYLPGACGFDGAAPSAFGDEAEDVHNITDIVFTGLFRGGAVGHIVGTAVALPVEEISETDAFSVVTTYPSPRPVGSFVPRGTTFANTDAPIQGPSSNIGDGEHYGLVRQINSQIRNDGGTPATADVIPRTRELLYWRLWTDSPPEGTLVAMTINEEGRVFRAWRDPDDALVIQYWTQVEWRGITTSLTITGNGAMAFDGHSPERLWLVLENGSGGIDRRYTQDEGRNFSMATTVTSSGNNPAVTPSPTGVLYVFWVDGDAIKSKAWDATETVIIAERTVVSSNVADSPIAGVYSFNTVDQRAVIFLTYRNDSNALITLTSQDGGLTYA